MEPESHFSFHFLFPLAGTKPEVHVVQREGEPTRCWLAPFSKWYQLVRRMGRAVILPGARLWNGSCKGLLGSHSRGLLPATPQK